MTLRQSQFVSPVPLIVAEARGLLTDIDLDTRSTTGSPEQLRGLLSGDIDVAVTAIDNLFAWVPQGADVRLVALVESTTPLGLFARRGIAATISDLQGRRFGVDAASNGFALAARYLLNDANVTVDFVEIGGVKERLDALLDARVDATLLGPPFDATALDEGAIQLASVPDLLPGFPGQGLVARTGIVESSEFVTYLAALRKATEISNRLSNAEGAALLASAGFGAAASSAWHARPRTLRVPAAGLDLLTRIRSKLHLLPAGVVLHDLCVPGTLGED